MSRHELALEIRVFKQNAKRGAELGLHGEAKLFTEMADQAQSELNELMQASTITGAHHG